MIKVEHINRFHGFHFENWTEENEFLIEQDSQRLRLYQFLIRQGNICEYPFKNEYQIPLNGLGLDEYRRFLMNMANLSKCYSWEIKGYIFIVRFFTLHEALQFADTHLEQIKQIAWESVYPETPYVVSTP